MAGFGETLTGSLHGAANHPTEREATMTDPATFPESTLVPLNGVTLEVFEAGRENVGNPIVLCHGWPEHAFCWRYQVPALAKAGYHVLIPNQRGYGRSSCPDDVSAYGIEELTGDLVALLDHYGYDDAVFVGHDWGAMVVWGLTLLHPRRVRRVVNLALPYQERGERPWIAFMEAVFGADYYFVHFNRQPGVADAVLDANARRFLQNLYRKNVPPAPPGPGNMMMALATALAPLGEPVMSDEDLDVVATAFESNGFTGSINWYRNLDRNWHTLADVDPIIRQPTLMIHGTRDPIPVSAERLAHFVPNVDVVSLECGHWIQQELPDETNGVIVDWLARADA